MSWYAAKYSQPARTAALQSLGWNLVQVGAHWYWRKPDGSNASARDVRKALKARFPLHFDPETTYGQFDTPAALSV